MIYNTVPHFTTFCYPYLFLFFCYYSCHPFSPISQVHEVTEQSECAAALTFTHEVIFLHTSGYGLGSCLCGYGYLECSFTLCYEVFQTHIQYMRSHSLKGKKNNFLTRQIACSAW